MDLLLTPLLQEFYARLQLARNALELAEVGFDDE